MHFVKDHFVDACTSSNEAGVNTLALKLLEKNSEGSPPFLIILCFHLLYMRFVKDYFVACTSSIDAGDYTRALKFLGTQTVKDFLPF